MCVSVSILVAVRHVGIFEDDLVPERPSGVSCDLVSNQTASRQEKLRYDQAELRTTRCDIKGTGRHIIFTDPKQSFRTGPVLRAILQPLVVEAVCDGQLTSQVRLDEHFDCTGASTQSYFQCSTPHTICIRVACRHAPFLHIKHSSGLQVLLSSSLHTNLCVSVVRRHQSCGSDRDKLNHLSFFWSHQLDLRWLWISGLLPLTQQHISWLDLSLIILLWLVSAGGSNETIAKL